MTTMIIRPRTVIYNEDTDCLELVVYMGGGVYEIPMDRCKTHEELVEWICHLSGKNWFNNAVCRDMIEVWGALTKNEIYGM